MESLYKPCRKIIEIMQEDLQAKDNKAKIIPILLSDHKMFSFKNHHKDRHHLQEEKIGEREIIILIIGFLLIIEEEMTIIIMVIIIMEF